MDTVIKIKEGNPLSNNIASENETEFFTKSVSMKTKSDFVLVDNSCGVAIKTEIKSETSLPDFGLQEENESFTKHLKQIKSETVTCSNNCEIDTITGSDSQTGTQCISEYHEIKVKKHNSNHEMDHKIEIKVETWGLESETSFLCDDIKDEYIIPVKSPRLCTEAVDGDSCGHSPLLSTEISAKNISFSNVKDCDSQKINVRKYLHSEQSGKYNEGEHIYNSALLIHKSKKTFKCEICEKNFNRLSHLKNHSMIHESEKSYKCEICDKKFSQLSSLRRHYLIHQGKKPHKCEICERCFTRVSDLKQHNLIHEGKKPHKCEICEKCFTRLSDLKQHNLRHEGKRPHKCETCEKSFTHLSHLKEHYLIHEGKRPHKCEICGKSFTQLATFRRHTLMHESKKVPS